MSPSTPHTLVVDEAGDTEIACPTDGYGDCGLVDLDSPEMVDSVNRFGTVAIACIDFGGYLGPPDQPMLPPGEDQDWDDWVWEDVHGDLAHIIDHDEWYPKTGTCGVAEWIHVYADENVPSAPGRHTITWQFEGELDDWWIDFTTTPEDAA